MLQGDSYQVSIKRWWIVISQCVNPTKYHVVITIWLSWHAPSIFPSCSWVELRTHIWMQRKQGYLRIRTVFYWQFPPIIPWDYHYNLFTLQIHMRIWCKENYLQAAKIRRAVSSTYCSNPKHKTTICHVMLLYLISATFGHKGPPYLQKFQDQNAPGIQLTTPNTRKKTPIFFQFKAMHGNDFPLHPW